MAIGLISWNECYIAQIPFGMNVAWIILEKLCQHKQSLRKRAEKSSDKM